MGLSGVGGGVTLRQWPNVDIPVLTTMIQTYILHILYFIYELNDVETGTHNLNFKQLNVMEKGAAMRKKQIKLR